MKSEGHSWMKLRQRYHSTHFMHVMLDLRSLQTPTPQHHKTPDPQNASKARTPGNPTTTKHRLCPTHSCPTQQRQHISINIGGRTSSSAAHPRQFKCMSVVPQVMRVASTEDAQVGQVGTSYQNKQLTSTHPDNRRIYKPEHVASP